MLHHELGDQSVSRPRNLFNAVHALMEMLVQVRRADVHCGGTADNRETVAGDHSGAEFCRSAGCAGWLEEDMKIGPYSAGSQPLRPLLLDYTNSMRNPRRPSVFLAST